MKKVFVLLTILFLASFSYCETLQDAISLIIKKDYRGAINILKSLPSDRKVNYYLSEAYFLDKDFENSAEFSKKVISEKGDFYYQKALYNLIFSSYVLNRFSDTYTYGIEYLNNVGDNQGAESSVLTFVVSALQLSGNIGEARNILDRYKEKYPNLYLALSSNINKYEPQIISGNGKTRNEEVEKLNILYGEIIRDILSSLEKISSKRDAEIEKLQNIILLLELKEEALKIKKYRLIIGE
ncbi:MAG: hypothetical protein ACP5QP_05415 [Brevinematia bacterium]